MTKHDEVVIPIPDDDDCTGVTSIDDGITRHEEECPVHDVPTDRELVARFVSRRLALIGDPPVRPENVTIGMLMAYWQDVDAYRASHEEE